MLKLAFCLSVLIVFGVRCDIYEDILQNHDDIFKQAWGWEQPNFEARLGVEPDAEIVENDREPLSPDWKDPATAGSEQKPVATPQSQDSPTTARPGFLPGSVIDVNANGGFPNFPSFTSPFGPSFDLPQLNPGAFGFGGIFGIEDNQKWWKGKHVCIEREEETDDDDEDEKEGNQNKNETTRREPHIFDTSIRLSNCFETANKYECITKINNHGVVKTFTVRYKCCYGYQRNANSVGCTEHVDLKPLVNTLNDVNLTEFRQLITSTGLENNFINGNYTVFAPSDDALNEYNEKLNEVNLVARKRREIQHTMTERDLVLSHVTKGFRDLQDFSNEDVITSENNNSTIRINIYPTQSYLKMLTANCARVKKGNILAENGIVHITDRVVQPATEDVSSIINRNPELSIFKQILEKTDIPGHFKPEGHYTIFAPTNNAFNLLEDGQKHKLLNGGGCASNILKHHITAHTVCSSAIIGNATTHNVEGNILNLERTDDDEIIFEGNAKIVESDIMATNGVIHLIDTVIIPESGQYIGKVLKDQNHTKFYEIVEKAGLLTDINSLDNITIFVPSNNAFEQSQTKKLLEEIGDDKTKLRELVLYHTVDGQIQSSDMNNNMKLKTKDSDEELRVNLYSTLPLFTNIINRATVNCARLVAFDERACGSMVHEVNRVLVPPIKSLWDMVDNDPKYSTLKDIIKGTDLEQTLKETNRSLTLLAPTDESFAGLDENDKKLLLEDKYRAAEILRGHILSEVLCCSGVGPHTWGFNSVFPTLGNQQVEISRTGIQIRVNRAAVIGCDNVATNGVLHTINRVLLPRKTSVSAVGGFFLFDI